MYVAFQNSVVLFYAFCMYVLLCFQCFDTAGLASGSISGCKKHIPVPKGFPSSGHFRGSSLTCGDWLEQTVKIKPNKFHIQMLYEANNSFF